MDGRMRAVLVGGVVLVTVALGAAFTKRKVEDDAYYNQHLKAAHAKYAERRAKATELQLPMEAAAFKSMWGEGPDMWPILTEIRRDMTANKMWPEAANYPMSHFIYSFAASDMPDLEPRLMSLAACTTCQSIPDMDKGAMSEQASTATARGVTRILAAKSDQEMNRSKWADAEKSILLADHIANAAATGPNRDGLLTWAGNQLSLHRKMLITMNQGHVEPGRLAFFRSCLEKESAAPDMVPSINFEYFTRYWAATNYSSLTPQQLAEIVVFSPSEDIPPPTHHAASEAMTSAVLDGWISAVQGAKALAKNPREAGIIADDPFIKAYLRKTESDYILVTMDTVFEQTGTMLARALETRALTYAAVATVAAEQAGQPLPDMAKLAPPQNDYQDRKFIRTKTSDGWVISLADTKNPTAQPYGLSDRIPDNVLAFRWKSRKVN
jgi:hypothetical protein